MPKSDPCCAHCGAMGALRLNPWLPWPSYECAHVGGVPACAEGQSWYMRNTWQTVAGRDLTPEAEEKSREERR